MVSEILKLGKHSSASPALVGVLEGRGLPLSPSLAPSTKLENKYSVNAC